MIDAHNEDPGKDGFRRLYTSQIEQMPGQLSYQNIKLANFLQLELADLWDSLQQINQDNFKNQLKESLSRSYNVFHEMKKLYNDLGMNFLYMQSKKLISSYGVIFVYLIDRLEQHEKSQQNKTRTEQKRKQNVSSFEEEVRKNIETIKMNKCAKENRSNKRNKGVHLFNQSYARCIDYDLEAFRQIRQKMKQNQKSQEEKRLMKIQEERKFRKEVVDQLNDFSYLKVDGEQLYVFLNRHRKMDEMVSKISLEDELQKIAVFFKQSQHQALQFLRKQKNLQSFHELTEGFNLIVTEYQNNKTNQIFFVKDKIKQILELLSKKLLIFDEIIKNKDKKIQELQQLLANKQITTGDQYTQTIFNYDQENKQLQRRIITSELVNEELRMYITKINEQQRKEKSSLMQQLTVKESNFKQTKDTLQERLAYIIKLQKKYKMLVENAKMKNIQDPFQFFNGMSEEMKKFFCEELQQKGYLKPSVKHEIKHSSFRRNTKLSHQKKDSNLSQPHSEMQDKVINNQSTPESHTNQRRKSLRKKAGSNFFKENQTKVVENQAKSGHLQFLVPDEDLRSENGSTLSEGSRKNSFNDKQSIYKSKKIITIRPVQVQNQDKVRVFDIHDRNGNSQKFVDFQSGKKLQFLRNEGNTHPQQKEKNLNYLRVNKQLSRKSTKTNQSGHQRSEDEQQNYTQSNQTSQKSVIDITMKNRLKKFQTTQVSEKSQEDSIDTQKQYPQLKNQRKSSLSKKLSGRGSAKRRPSYVTKEFSEEEQTQEFRQMRRAHRKMRPSCEQSIKQQQGTEMSEKQLTQLNSMEIKEKYSKNMKKCSIVNSFNLTISNLPTPTTSKIVSIIESEMSKKLLTDKSNSRKENKQFLTEEAEAQQNFKQNYGPSEKIYDQMKVTVRRTKNKQISEKDEIQCQKSDNSIGKRKTKTKKLKENISKEINPFIQSASSTFHKQIDKNKLHPQAQQNSKNFGSNTLTTFKNSESNRRESKQKAGRSLQKTKSLIRVSQHNSNTAIKLIQDQFGESDIIEASRKCNTVEEFKNQVLHLHKSQCGQNCKHLQRYINIFQKLKKQNYRTKRQFIKMHVENMNEKLGVNEEGALFNLPVIGKK